YNRITAGLAIAAYERTLLANEAPFQRWLRGEQDAMNTLEKEGALVFFGKGNCASCHTGPALNSMEFHAIGLGDLQDCPEEVFLTPDDAVEHLGRGGFTNRPEDMFKFKVPQLYNLKDSPFYGHGGTLRSLREVVAYKNEAVPQNPDVPATRLADEFEPLGLTEQEVDAITAFLETALYDPNLERYVPESLPTGLCFPNADSESMEDLGCQ
ncbi:MAG: c-type cytochrome, partial [Bacteroidetes bacterium]|nr:c-type cytochrome [Bacteroidota bacterium]